MKKHLLLAIAIGLVSHAAFAGETVHPFCESMDMEVKVDDMGMVDEETLMQHMEDPSAPRCGQAIPSAQHPAATADDRAFEGDA